MYQMVYHDLCSFDDPTPIWRSVDDCKDDRVEVLLRWSFNYYVSRTADSDVCHDERLVFWVLNKQLVDMPEWALSLHLFDVDQQRECTVTFRLLAL